MEDKQAKDIQKRVSELTDADREYEWIQIEFINTDDPLCIRGRKVSDPPVAPEGYEWIDATSFSDTDSFYILGLKQDDE